MSFEQITISGNIGSTEIMTSKGGVQYLKVSVACNRGSGEKKVVSWYDVMLFGKLVENIDVLVQYYTKGRIVTVSGRPQNSAYPKKDGTIGLSQSIIASGLPQLLDSNKVG